MDLRWSPAEEAFRGEARDWLDANVPRGLPSGDTRAGFAAHLAWERALHAARWAVVSWPRDYGGREATLWEWLIFEEEYYRAGAPQRVTQNGIFLLAPTLFEFGTPEQRDRYPAPDGRRAGPVVPGLVRAGCRERPRGRGQQRGPGRGGRRLAVVRAEDMDDARSVLHAPVRLVPHRSRGRAAQGLTYFLVPLDAPGVTVRGFPRLDGDEGFADVFLDEVFVPDGDVLGAVNQGWQVAMATAGSERGLTLRSPGRFTASADRLLDLYRERPSAGAARPGRAVLDRGSGLPDVHAPAGHPAGRRQAERTGGQA